MNTMFENEDGNHKTHVAFGDVARDGMFKGMCIVADAVGSTLGPMGRCVIIEKELARPHVTKDGVTVSRSIRLTDGIESLGAELIKEAAHQTNELAGDGTTTATVLTHAMCSEGRKMLASGHRHIDIVKSIDDGVEAIVAGLKTMSRPVTDAELESVATISANGERAIGSLIAKAIGAVKRDGIVTVEQTKSSDTTLDVVKGLRMDRGYMSPYFVTDNDKMRCSLSDAYVLVCDETVSSLAEFVPVMEAIHKQGKPIIVIAPEVEGEALQLLVVNRLQNNLQACAVGCLAYDFGMQRTESLIDICSIVGGRICSASTGGMRSMRINDLGRARSIVVDRYSTTIVIGEKAPKAALERSAAIRSQLDEMQLDESATAMMRDRLSKLAGSAAVIRVGGATEIEIAERRDRIDDALNATRAAIDEGIIPGGGTALCQLAKSAGSQIIEKACLAPLRRIVENAGGFPDVVMQKVQSSEQGVGYDAYAETYVNMMDAGIVDPVKVARIALEKAASVAKSFIMLSAAVTRDNK